MSSRTKALIAIILAALLGATAGVAKIIIRLTDPYVVAFLRFFVASVVILPFFLREKRKTTVKIRTIIPLALFSCANIGFYYIGLQTSTANAASLIYAGVPLITLILANRFLREPLTIQKFVGILTGLIGVVVIVLLPIVEHGGQTSGTFPGNFFFIAATLVWSLYTIGSRYAITAKGYSPLVISSVSIFTTCILFFIISLFTFQSTYLPQLINTKSILIILHLGIMVTVAMYFLFQLGIQYSSATTASLGNYFGPVFAILFNVILLGESVTPVFIIGSVLVLTGVIITSGTRVLHEVRRWIHR